MWVKLLRGVTCQISLVNGVANCGHFDLYIASACTLLLFFFLLLLCYYYCLYYGKVVPQACVSSLSKPLFNFMLQLKVFSFLTCDSCSDLFFWNMICPLLFFNHSAARYCWIIKITCHFVYAYQISPQLRSYTSFWNFSCQGNGHQCSVNSLLVHNGSSKIQHLYNLVSWGPSFLWTLLQYGLLFCQIVSCISCMAEPYHLIEKVSCSFMACYFINWQ